MWPVLVWKKKILHVRKVLYDGKEMLKILSNKLKLLLFFVYLKK